LSVIPVTANNSMPTSDNAALIQCHVCNCLSHQPRHLRFAFGAVGLAAVEDMESILVTLTA
jgi:hypothetical protein